MLGFSGFRVYGFGFYCVRVRRALLRFLAVFSVWVSGSLFLGF